MLSKAFKPIALSHAGLALVTLLLAGTCVGGVARADDLHHVLSEAYKFNPQIKSRREQQKGLDEQVNQQASGWLPTVAAEYSTGRQRTQATGANDWIYSDLDNKSLTITQPLFNGGETVFGVSSAKNSMLAGRAELQGTTQQVFQEAVAAYMNVVRDKALVKLSENNRNVLRKQFEASTQRFEVGEVTRTDVSQSQARLSRATSDAIQARGALQSSLANLERVVGYLPDETHMPDMSVLPIPATMEEAVELSMKDNPLVVAARYREDAADDGIYVAGSAILPDVSLVGSMSRQDGAGFRGSDTFDNDSVRLNVRVPLYQSGAEYSRVREAKVNASRRMFDLKDQNNRVREETIAAWEAYQTSVATIEAQQSAIDAAEVALDGVKQEQLFGARTVLDVLDAEQELFIAKVNLVRAEREKVVSAYRLLAVMGRLTPQELKLDAKPYNPQEHYDDVFYQFIGF